MPRFWPDFEQIFDQIFGQVFEYFFEQIFGRGFGEAQPINTVYSTTRPKENTPKLKKASKNI